MAASPPERRHRQQLRPGSRPGLLRGDERAAYLLLLPAFLGLALFRVYPILAAAAGSLYRQIFSATGPSTVFVGLGNFAVLLHDPVFWHALWVTLKLNVILNPMQVVLALLLALMVDGRSRAMGAYRVLLLVPIGVSLPVATILWRLMLDPNSGFVNALLGFVGLPHQPFYTSSGQALWSIMLIANWKGLSYWMVFVLAGLQSIPGELLEAAAIDGASGLQRLFRVTLPLLRRPLTFVLVADTVINFVMFVPMYLLTRGGPSGSTNVLMYQAYKVGFAFGDMGGALAIVTVLLAIILAVVAVQFRLLEAGRQAW
ncbi:MAG TPA: sugar ABC transporter permease [Trueperaceae bacterium]|nr:sugar ABC transporter permease [Trueperaceae bacterium]